jgi:exodeoxyribonuclease VII large subunit
MENQALSLYQLLGQVKSALKSTMQQSYWILAEISELKVNYSGHCYLELIEKELNSESIKAKARATIWSSVFRMLQPYFETSAHIKLSAGIKVMVKITVEFHELYGFSLNITDIEPSYTIGELALQKREIINRLIAEGVYGINKELKLTELPRKIAVISSRTAAGYGDFLDQLRGNPFGYKFYVMLYPAVMQGVEAEQSIIGALDKINEHEDIFDVVVIIRGGGAQSELHCFNNYWLAYNICQFPLPVLTGIGHEQDETIADMVAYQRLKTPTAAAEFLVALFRNADEKVNELSVSLSAEVSELVNSERNRLDAYLMELKPVVKQRISLNLGDMKFLKTKIIDSIGRFLLKQISINDRRSDMIKVACHKYLNSKIHHQEMLEKKCLYLDPYLILKRGYSVTYYNGVALKDPTLVKSNELIETRLASGKLKSKTI